MNSTVWAVSDLHVSHKGNESLLAEIVPESPDDWIIIAGDIGERTDLILSVLQQLKENFAQVIWVPGNHELYTTPKDPVQYFGQFKYEYLVDKCREMGVTTPEDDYLIWQNSGQTIQLVPMFLLYDYSFLPYGETDSAIALQHARQKNVYATDEFLIKPLPFPSMVEWCADRVSYTEQRLETLDQDIPKVFINHWPLIKRPTELLFQEYFSLWCGTQKTSSWHQKYNVVCSIFGHLHIPHTSWVNGVRFEEVSIGYPREWNFRGKPAPLLRRILPLTTYDLEKDGTEIFRASLPAVEKSKLTRYQRLIASRRKRNGTSI